MVYQRNDSNRQVYQTEQIGPTGQMLTMCMPSLFLSCRHLKEVFQKAANTMQVLPCRLDYATELVTMDQVMDSPDLTTWVVVVVVVAGAVDEDTCLSHKSGHVPFAQVRVS